MAAELRPGWTRRSPRRSRRPSRTSAAQLAGLVDPGFVTATGRRRLPDLPRYLAAAEHRLDRLPGDPPGTPTGWPACTRCSGSARLRRRAAAGAARARDPVRQLRWMIEELRVSVFAQALGTPYPVSEQRIYRAMDQLD